MDNIDWNKVYAAVWRPRKEALHPVKSIDPVTLKDLTGINNQIKLILDNTRPFIEFKPANNVLLWGAKGTGKSSLVKAVLNEFAPLGLRLIEVDKDDLIYLPEIVDDIRDLKQRFIVYCDDLSFDANEHSYKHLKSILEGSIELPPDNILLYATSNRRHLMPEHMRDNLDTQLINDELHYSDTVEEKTSLADRFGLWISFYPVSMSEYLNIVDAYFRDYHGDREELHAAAKRFALARAGKSGRTAKQFYLSYNHKLLK